MEITTLRSVRVYCKCGKQYGSCAGLSKHISSKDVQGPNSDHNGPYFDDETKTAIDRYVAK